MNLNELNSILEKKVKDEFDKKDIQKYLENYIISTLNLLNKKDIGEFSFIKSPRSDREFIVRFTDSDTREKAISIVKQFLKQDKELKIVDKKLSKHSKPATYITFSNPELSFAKIKILWKFSIATRRGLSFEHILVYLFTGKPTKSLKASMDISLDSSTKEVNDSLNSPVFSPLLSKAIAAKSKIESTFSNIEKVEHVGGKGIKADILIYRTEEPKKIGISLKNIEKKFGKNPYHFNKRLGHGIDKLSLIPNPNNEPWWLTARNLYISELKKLFPEQLSNENLLSKNEIDPPNWLKHFFDSNGSSNEQIYAKISSKVLNIIKSIFIFNLRKLPISKNDKTYSLESLIEEAHFGKPIKDTNKIPLYKLSVSESNIKLEYITLNEPDLLTISANQLSSKDMVISKGSEIHIIVPGMEPGLIIHGLKWAGGNFMSASESNLEIKSR